ncbi:MAG TPA: malto-oligosyltrehalose synthase [Candidatus Limnocylindrales bacterium]|nr:malto-oligosyltrehalose synthase [Candidatus Limnocylindrales bacterium]
MTERQPVAATYRLQLHPDFGFDAAAEIAGYLARLGVTHVYLSPLLQAAPGSTHGYDVVDPTRVNDDLGGPAGYERLQARLREAGLGQVLDVVPNHMAITGPENPWWWDVLENGPSSRYARYFDVAWDPPEPRLKDLILVPVLADHYGRVLEAGQLRLERQAASFRLRYSDHRFPLSPRSLGHLLRSVPAAPEGWEAIADALQHLPEPGPLDREASEQRHELLAAARRRLATLLRLHPALASSLDGVLAAINADPDRLDAVLELQHYRLARWQTAAWDLDYRRFFDINTLAGIRVSDSLVFLDTHRLVLAWLRQGVLDGIRVDHPDGLRDPREYFDRLRRAAPTAWIVVEKILAPGEPLPEDWPVDGTTGYDAARLVTGLLIDPSGERPLTALYQELTGERDAFAQVAYACKHLVMRELLGSDVRRLLALLGAVCEKHRRSRDYTRRELEQALREVIACFPVYRTYVRPSEPPRDQDVAVIERAVGEAERCLPHLDHGLFAFLRDLLRLRLRGSEEEEFVARFQQTTGPVTAKAVEDTAFYRYHRLVCLNEVGSDPGRFGVPLDEYHAHNLATQRRWPGTMVASSTHDTKRSEDVRARLALLSEIPGRWQAAVAGWVAHNARHRRGPYPDRNTEYLLYQTLYGAHPIGASRLWGYMQKAVREAKRHTSWLEPNAEYEGALAAFIEAIGADRWFQDDLAAFTEPLIPPGRVNALSLKLLTLTAPGVPDVYQGTELWSLTLVDPDNREPVDFTGRDRLLAELDRLTPEAAMARAEEGVPKLLLTARALALRRRLPECFGPQGTYTPLAAEGGERDRVVAFQRGAGAITVVPRLVMGLAGGFRDTGLRLPPGRWRNELTGEVALEGAVALDRLLARFPVALLTCDG